MPKKRATPAPSAATEAALGAGENGTSTTARRWLAGGLVAGALIAYHNSFCVPFLFDDIPAIVENPSIRRLWPLSETLLPDIAGGVTTAGRPLVNLSLALNYQISGLSVWSYHVTNLLLHLSAGLLLFGLVRRTLELPLLRPQWGRNAALIGAGTAALWLLHPLQTAAVTYMVQRAEILVSVCLLLTLYAFVRGTTAARPRAWFALAVVACLLGMASKEVMVAAPVIVFFYDRTFVAGSFAEAWRRHRLTHLSLAATWLLLAALVLSTEGRGDTAGFDVSVTPSAYALTQAHAIIRYLWLTIWPAGLTFDYGTAVITSAGDVWFQLTLLAALAGATLYALRQRPTLGFVGLWFFALLAPSSSVVPISSQTMAEHRMYLALAGPALLFVVGLHAWLGRRSLWAVGVASVAALAVTADRNRDYQSDFAIWHDTVRKLPTNPRGHHNLGLAAFGGGDALGAIAHYDRALELAPASPETHYNRGVALARLERWAEAVAAYDEAVRLQPEHAEAENNLGTAWLARGAAARAVEHYRRAIELKPAYGDAHSNLSNALLETGRVTDAIRHGEEAVRLQPASAVAAYNLGNALAQARRLADARRAYERTVALMPNHAGGWNNLGNVLLELEQWSDAATAYERAVQFRPDLVPARRNLIQLLEALGRLPEAIDHCRALVKLTPDDPVAQAELVRLIAAAKPRHGR